MAKTYEAIATVEVGAGGAANITFNSIPQTYTDLVCLIFARNTSTALGTGIRASLNSYPMFNGKIIFGDGYNPNSAGSPDIAISDGNNNTANTFSNCYFYIPNYTSSNQKSIIGDSVVENNAIDSYVVQYNSINTQATSAITSIVLTLADASNFMQYSTATLYGISNS